MSSWGLLYTSQFSNVFFIFFFALDAQSLSTLWIFTQYLGLLKNVASVDGDSPPPRVDRSPSVVRTRPVCARLPRLRSATFFTNCSFKCPTNFYHRHFTEINSLYYRHLWHTNVYQRLNHLTSHRCFCPHIIVSYALHVTQNFWTSASYFTLSRPKLFLSIHNRPLAVRYILYLLCQLATDLSRPCTFSLFSATHDRPP